MKLNSRHRAAAMKFFADFMHGPLQAKLKVYASRNVRMGSAVTPSDWEVFASLLTGRKGNGGVSGVDLGTVEVKSAFKGGSFEYQYHKDTGLSKLANDMKSGHLFVVHANFLNNVEVWFVEGKQAKDNYFSKWLANYPNPYPQRYRRSIPFGWVKRNGKKLLVLENGKMA